MQLKRKTYGLALVFCALGAFPPWGTDPAWGAGGDTDGGANIWSTLAETYQHSLERLGEEDHSALLSVVADLEVAALADEPASRLDKLRTLELYVARRLAKQDPEILVPIFKLHHDLYLEHRAERQWYLLLHSVAMVRDLSELYVKKTKTEGARRVASQVLSSLGGHLQVGGVPTSRMLFNEALELEPTNEAALLGLAAHYEKYGGPFEESVRYLRQLTEAYPEHREGRLRLGVNLLRLERVKAAVEVLEKLLVEEGSDWIYRLAAQELARQWLREDRFNDAIGVLETALGRAPGDQKLQIQLAFCYERNRRSFDSLRLAEEVEATTTGGEPPRGRYNRWPNDALEYDREELRRMAQSRAQLLARALGKESPRADEVREQP